MNVNQETLLGDDWIYTTYGPKTRIKSFQALLVFKPEVRRGINGVMLTDFLGIGDSYHFNV